MYQEEISLSKFKKPYQLDKSITEGIEDKKRKENIIKAENELGRLKKDPKSGYMKLDLKDIDVTCLTDDDKEAFWEAFKEKKGWDEYSEGFRAYEEIIREYKSEKKLNALDMLKDSRATFAGMIRQHVVEKTDSKIRGETIH